MAQKAFQKRINEVYKQCVPAHFHKLRGRIFYPNYKEKFMSICDVLTREGDTITVKTISSEIITDKIGKFYFIRTL